MNEDMQAQLQSLLDREAIRDLLYRYCHGADRCDEAMLRGIYWPEATDDHGVFSGRATDYIAFLLDAAGQMDQLHHLVGNILIRIDGWQAKTETYFFSYQRLRVPSTGPRDLFASGRYIDVMEKRGTEWRILQRRVVFDGFRLLDDSADWTQGLLGTPVPMGRRAPDDPSCRMFEQRT